MKRHVFIRPAAEADIKNARDWYETQRPTLGDEFLVSIAEAISRIEEAPERYLIYHKGFRRVLIQRFPYKIFYRIEGGDVVIFRVLHTSRDHSRQL